jgi:hypothetical protein
VWQKLQNVSTYLRSFLGGDAAQVIKSLELSSENYDAAWQLLYERYDN